MMAARKKWVRGIFACAMSGAMLFGFGPCGITSLQLRDFLISSAIRTGVTTLASVIEAATVANADN